MQAKAASDARLARDIQEAEDRAEANAAEEARLRQEEWDSIDRSALMFSCLQADIVSRGLLGLVSALRPSTAQHAQPCEAVVGGLSLHI